MTQQHLQSTAAKPTKPAVEGWFRSEPEPCLLGSQCTACGSYFFPRETFYCKNPHCTGSEFQEVELSRTGTLWSFTNGCYKPPPPFVAPEPFTPYVLAAVELAKEQMVILGQVPAGVAIDTLKIGMPMRLVIDTLFEDAEYEHTVWKWTPAGSRS
jgi:uncharacterized OB-fold protein